MKYHIDVFDGAGLRVARFHETPLLEVRAGGPDGAHVIRGLLPASIQQLDVGHRIDVYLDDILVCSAMVSLVAPQWGDSKKLILDRYVTFHELVEVEARRELLEYNASVSQAYTNAEVGAIVRDVINRAHGPLHYRIAHSAYPEGAAREYQKFSERRNDANALAYRDISAGHWAGADRIDAASAFAKDGDTIAGLVVDGIPWPDLRLMMIDCEETSRNSHAIARHPEVSLWTDEQYASSPYQRRADAARQFLQSLLNEGIAYIELNPHRNAAGAFDDRVDAYGRYLGLVFGAGQCFNAALVEKDLADVYLYANGAYLAPELALKEFYSYTGACASSVADTGVTLEELDVAGGALEIIAALGYAAGGYGFTVDPRGSLAFGKHEGPSHVLFYSPQTMSVQWAEDGSNIVNLVLFSGDPLAPPLARNYARTDSIERYGCRPCPWSYFSLSRPADADRLMEALLDDLAYPVPNGAVRFLDGTAQLAPGDLVELRNPPLRRLASPLEQAWGGRFGNKLIARVQEVRHHFSGQTVSTVLTLTSPLRSVERPLAFITRSQSGADSLFAFRLDEAAVGLDMGFHLD